MRNPRLTQVLGLSGLLFIIGAGIVTQSMSIPHVTRFTVVATVIGLTVSFLVVAIVVTLDTW